jgi:murein DD-endopeptidase MepM/ murein hydrolase activator NlpD
VNPVALAAPLVLAATALTTTAVVHARPRAPAPVAAPAAAPVATPAATRVAAPAATPAVGPLARPEEGATVTAAPAPRGAVADARAEPAPRGRWTWPLAPRPRVVRRFVPPPSPYAAGHRGVDLAATVGQPVTAVAAGTVTHVGRVAGRGTVTVSHADGLRSTYEPVVPSVALGQQVARGAVVGRVGTVAAGASHCLPRTCLHLGALRERVYLDPLRLLGVGRVRLLPLGQAPDG